MSILEQDYLERRRRESLSRAEEASDPAVARVHRDFANLYERKLEAKPPPAATPRA